MRDTLPLALRRIRTLLACAACVSGCDSSATEVLADDCTVGSPISLNVGEATHFEGASTATLCISGASGQEEFLLVTASLAESGTVAINVQGDDLLTANGPPNPSPARVASAFAPQVIELDREPTLQDTRFHSVLRKREERQLSARIVGGLPGPGRAPATGSVSLQSLGELISLNTETESACENPRPTAGRVEAVSDRAIIVADTANPPGGFGAQDFLDLAMTFDTLVAPVVEEHFGTTGDVDGNGRVIIFFTKEVNALSVEDEALTAGFFFSRDLFPVASPGPPLGSCASSNEAELLYLIVPDPQGDVGEPISRAAVMRLTTVTLAHEYHHLINASQRLLDTAGPRPFEESWLNEALSHAAEELLFYRVAGLSPRLDLGAADLTAHQIDALNDFQRLNFFRLIEFLKAPEDTSPFDPDVGLATRGAGWSFLRYSADRVGGDDAIVFRRLVDSSATGLDNLAEAIGGRATLFDWLGDWGVGLYADNRVASLPARFQDLSWDNFSLFEAGGFAGPYIATSGVITQSVALRNLKAGAAAYFRFAVGPGRVGRISIRRGINAPPPTLRATVLRTR